MQSKIEVTQLEEKLLVYIKTEFLRNPSHPISRSDDLLDTGALDSLAIVLLTEYISTEFGLEIDADDVTPDNFESVASIAALIGSKLPA